jgi:uncharacterized protein YecE (DUF72 family)
MSRGRAYVGTSGFGYKSWIPRFYAEGTKPRDFLRRYAERLPSVESNYTFNALPTEQTLASWVEATPPTFRFALKASRRITHGSLLLDTRDTLPLFLDRVRLLGERLGCILYQTPPWLHRDEERLRSFLSALPPGRSAFEFRHESWYDESVYAILRERDVALVTAEGEKAPAPYAETASFVYLRLREREAAYTDESLAGWKRRLSAALDGGRDAYVYLYHDEAGENAVMASRLWAELS